MTSTQCGGTPEHFQKQQKLQLIKPDQKVFYSDHQGWKMFDFQYLTTEIAEFLHLEAIALDRALDNHSSKYSHFVEVGCGYGRYLHWALSRNLKYDGIDLVSWLVDIGKIRINNMSTNLRPHVEIHNLSVEQIADILIEANENSSFKEKCLVFFPFNCFGNLENVHNTLKVLSQINADIFISTFRCDELTTECRKKYYQRCGYRNIKSETTQLGTLITSSEGLHAYAYDTSYLKSLFDNFGYHPPSFDIFGNIGLSVFVQSQIPVLSNLNCLS